MGLTVEGSRERLEANLKYLAQYLRETADKIDMRLERDHWTLSEAAYSTAHDILWMTPNMHLEDLCRKAGELERQEADDQDSGEHQSER